MDDEEYQKEIEGGFEDEEVLTPRTLPADLPKSLDDRQPVRSFGGETEYYDGWQGRTRLSGIVQRSFD